MWNLNDLSARMIINTVAKNVAMADDANLNQVGSSFENQSNSTCGFKSFVNNFRVSARTVKVFFAVGLMCACGWLSASAQTSASYNDIKPYIELKMGYNDITVMENIPNGVGTGFTAAIPVTKKAPLYFRTGLDVNYTGWSDMAYQNSPSNVNGSMVYLEDASKTRHANTIYATLPLTFAWEQHVADVISIKPYAGVYAKGYIWGSVSNEQQSANMMTRSGFTMDDGAGNQVEGYNVNRFNAGWQVGMDVHVKRFIFGAELTRDFGGFAENWGKPFQALTFHYGLKF